jgi:hypothetical protein
MPKLRYQPPDRLPGATNFSERPDLCGSVNVVQLVKSQPWVWDDLRRACELEIKYARKRIPGHWELVAIAFVVSGHVDFKPWWMDTNKELWRECGFARKPSFQTVHRRLRELADKRGEAFLEAAARVIRRCREHDKRVLAHVHFDWTEDETHAGLVHDCRAGEACAYQQRTGKRPRSRRRLRRVATEAAREVREQLNTEAPDESEKKEEVYLPDDEQARGSGKRFRINGCWYRTRDVDAGIRAYGPPGKTKRFWHGYYGGKAIDHFTSGVIPSVDSASHMEFHLFPELYDRVNSMLGDDETLETAIGDKGLSIASCFEHATRDNTAPVFPWRPPGGGDNKRHDKETHDRHGVMRCKHCGGPAQQIKFSTAGGEPRLWFRCVDGTETPGCAKEQTISCSKDWRLLVPLARTQPLYHELKQSHQTYEATHDYWRDRYKVCADNLAIRPKAVGLNLHRLRANVACFVEWLRIAAKQKWLKKAKKGVARLVGTRVFKKRGVQAASDLEKARTHIGLSEPYGPKAAALGIGRTTFPSERPRSKLPNQTTLDLPAP